MKNLVISALLICAFLFTSSHALAYDLEVSCDDTKCTLSSKDPVFEAGSHWAPGEIETREINIKNSGEHGKDIFLKATSGESQGLLDEYMNLRLFKQGTSTDIWSGTLAELLATQTVLIDNFTKNEEFELAIEAQMDNSTPNNSQGSSSSFDFGFGFDGEYRSEEDGNDDDSDDNNDSENSENSQTASIGSGAFSNNASSFLESIFGDSEESELEESTEEKEVKGVLTNQASSKCQDNNIWTLFVLLQALILIVGMKAKKFSHKIFAINGISFIASTLVIILTSCILWPLVLAGGLFAAAFLRYFKKPLIKRG